MTLPLGQPDDMGAEPLPEAPIPPRILLVDEDPRSLMMGWSFLVEQRLTVDVCHHYADATARLARRPYDALMLDCSSSSPEAWRLVSRWRERETAEGCHRHLPIVAFTSDTDALSLARCMSAGVDYWVHKPVNRSRLKEALTSCAVLAP